MRQLFPFLIFLACLGFIARTEVTLVKHTPPVDLRLTTFANHLNGNLLYAGNRAFDYEDKSPLTRLAVTNQWKSEFTYDGQMRRWIAPVWWTGRV